MSRIHLKSGNYIERFQGPGRQIPDRSQPIGGGGDRDHLHRNSSYVKRLVSELRSDGLRFHRRFWLRLFLIKSAVRKSTWMCSSWTAPLPRRNLSPKERVIPSRILPPRLRSSTSRCWLMGIERPPGQAEFRKVSSAIRPGLPVCKTHAHGTSFKKLDGEW